MKNYEERTKVVRLLKETLIALDKLKNHPKEPKDSVIARLIDFYLSKKIKRRKR